MPKKFKGVNTKAEAARERKQAARTATEEKKRQEEEDEYWKDDDKHVVRKEQRKADRERKRQEQLERKQAAKQLLTEEETQIGGKSKESGASAKVTRAQISEAQAELRRESGATASALPCGVTEVPVVEENPNRLLQQQQLRGEIDARTVDEAIAVLSVSKEEKHPEKRLKAAYAAFEERELPRLKVEYPNLRLSQLKQILRKDWMKSPENPLNQHFVSYNEKTKT